jgi:predicted nucleic acid-binding protein
MAVASLVATAERLGQRRVFSLDRHFYAYRLANGSAFEVFP